MRPLHTLVFAIACATAALILGTQAATGDGAAGQPPRLTASPAATAPACDDNWIPEAAGNIAVYDSPGGTYLGTMYWNPDWEDTPGWHSVVGETPVWIHLTGGWDNGVPTSSSMACIPSGADVFIRGSGGDHSFLDQPAVAPGAGTLQIATGAALEVTADHNNNAGHLAVSGDVYNAGDLSLDNWKGTLSAGGTITNSGTLTALAGNYFTNLDGNVDNEGTVSLQGDLTFGQYGSETFANNGTLTIASGQFTMLGSNDVLSQSGGTTNVGGGATLSIAGSGRPFSLTGGTLEGSGTIVGNVSNTGGIVHPGDSGSPGQLSIVGNYAQTAGGTLAVDIAGASIVTGYSHLAVTYTAGLDGTLDVNTVSYAPTAGQTFDILTAGAGIRGGFYAWTFHGAPRYHGLYDNQNAYLRAIATLTVAKAGNGSGTVTSGDSEIYEINCGVICSYSYDAAASVTLTAYSDPGSTFTGWSGGGCSGTGTCTVTISQDLAVTATFVTENLTVTKSGTGSGTVTSISPGISCGAICAYAYAYGTIVDLTAKPALGSSFAGWTGSGCSGTGICEVTMRQARAVTAVFTARRPVTMKISKAGAGHGSVTSSPAGISCGSTCSHAYPYGESVTLIAHAASRSVFTGWSGACPGAKATCHLLMTAGHAATATFAVARLLTVAKSGTGSGLITSSPAGISCGVACKYSFPAGRVVTLIASAQSGSKFTGWSGACTGTGRCVVKMSAAKSVRATFTLTTATH